MRIRNGQIFAWFPARPSAQVTGQVIMLAESSIVTAPNPCVFDGDGGATGGHEPPRGSHVIPSSMPLRPVPHPKRDGCPGNSNTKHGNGSACQLAARPSRNFKTAQNGWPLRRLSWAIDSWNLKSA